MLCSMNKLIPAITFFRLILLFPFPVITLHSIQIYRTHEWLHKLYFQCKGENQTILPEVTKVKTEYTFEGEESWQPLTELSSEKCKRRRFYEKGFLPFHDVVGEWELCGSDFTAPGGLCSHIKEKELKATFLCQTCVDLGSDAHVAPSPKSGGEGISIAIVILISAAVATVVLIGYVWLYKYCQKREAARTREIFEAV